MRKRIGKAISVFAIMAAIALVLFLSGCISGNTGLSLSGKVKHGSYDRFSPISGYGGYEDEYSVIIKATNWGNTVTYDRVEIFYDGGDGRGLSTTRVIRDETETYAVVQELGLAETDEIHSGSNGYTMDILGHTKTGKVALHVVFYDKGNAIDAFHAVLPSLIKWDDKPPGLDVGEEASLIFSRDYDAVMQEVRRN